MPPTGDAHRRNVGNANDNGASMPVHDADSDYKIALALANVDGAPQDLAMFHAFAQSQEEKTAESFAANTPQDPDLFRLLAETEEDEETAGMNLAMALGNIAAEVAAASNQKKAAFKTRGDDVAHKWNMGDSHPTLAASTARPRKKKIPNYQESEDRLEQISAKTGLPKDVIIHAAMLDVDYHAFALVMHETERTAEETFNAIKRGILPNKKRQRSL